jgi:RNA recognition motif-containing protein
MQGTGRQRGSCFVHFSNDEAGRAAVLAASRDLQRSERLGVLLSAEVSNTFRQYMERQGQGQGQRRRDLHALGERSQGMDGRDGSMHSPNQHVEMTFTDNAVYLPRLSHSFQPSYDLGAPAPASVMVPHAVGPILIPNGNLYYRPLYTGRINAVGQQIDPLQFVYYQQQDMISIPVASSMQSYAYGYAGERPFLLNSNNLGPSFIE